MNFSSESHRRLFLQRLALGSAAFIAPGAFADALTRTPPQTDGPFYPDKLPLDTDNDLLVINDRVTPAIGEVTHLSGRLLDASGAPISNAVIEIWQVDANAAYLHTKSGNRKKRDGNFQGFGRFLTGSTGEYYFRTIKPVPYPGRTPHIHVKVKRKGQKDFSTQCYIKGHKMNAKDGVLRRTKGAAAKAALMADFRPLPNSKAGELTAKFDVVLGHTPEDK